MGAFDWNFVLRLVWLMVMAFCITVGVFSGLLWTRRWHGKQLGKARNEVHEQYAQVFTKLADIYAGEPVVSFRHQGLTPLVKRQIAKAQWLCKLKKAGYTPSLQYLMDLEWSTCTGVVPEELGWLLDKDGECREFQYANSDIMKEHVRMKLEGISISLGRDDD